jgi:hypothetical protein
LCNLEPSTDDISQAVVSALTALSKNFTGLLLTRFFLGVTEAPYYPGGELDQLELA